MNSKTGAGDKPLSGFAKTALFLGAGATILLAYAFCAVSFLLVVALIGCEFVVLVVLARFGAARLMTWVVEAHGRLLVVIARSFRLRKGVEFRIPLQEADAPALFSMVAELCQKAGVKMPQEISLEMSVGAWVQLKGYRRGAGRTVLGIGYDLLAGLSCWEIQGVLAHEITHAKLVQRGYKNWLNRGLGRMIRLAQGLNAHSEAYRKAKRSIPPAQFLYRVTDQLTRVAARFVAGCSRQDEFDADLGAAALCGPGAIRSSLLKLDSLGRRAARLPWNERVAKLQTGEGFSNWLVSEFAGADPKPAEELNSNLFFKYSTHPSLADRLAALPDETDESEHDSTPAIRLLQNPDHAAETLISEIERVAAEEERKDSKHLRRFTRKKGQTNLKTLQGAGVLLCLAGAISVVVWAMNGMSLLLACFPVAFISSGILCYRFGRYRDKAVLAVPDYAVLKAAWQKKFSFTQDDVKKIEAGLRAQMANIRGRGKRESALAAAAYDSLSRCDYVPAHVAARLCLDINKKSIEGAVSLAVAAAALKQFQQVQHALNFLQRSVGMKTPSVSWGSGWALLLCGDWAMAEAFLEQRCQHQPQNPTVLLLLALCQSNRGKLRTALLYARQACDPEPVNDEHAKFLIDLLLRSGYLREAQEHVTRLHARANDDPEIMLLMVRTSLLLGDFELADRWTAHLKATKPGGYLFVQLGQIHEVARKDDQAAAYYGEASGTGYYPEALVGLARLHVRDRKRAEAKNLLISALDTGRELGEKAVGPLPLFHQTLGLLLSLQDPAPDCRAWVATLRGTNSPPGLQNKSLLIYAPARQQAEQFLNELFRAMQPATPPILSSGIGWSEARQEQQPDGPVRAGIQGVFD